MMYRTGFFRATVAGLFLCFVLFAFLCPGLIAETYQWKDQKGSVHFTDDLSKIPEEYRHEAVPVKMEPGKASDQVSSPGAEKADLSGGGQPVGAVRDDRECQFAIDRSIEEYSRRFNENMHRLRAYSKRIADESSISKRKQLEQERDALIQQMDQDATVHEEEIGRERENCVSKTVSTAYQECLARLNNSRLQHTKSLDANLHRLRAYSKRIGDESSISKRKQLEQERDALMQQMSDESKIKGEEFARELRRCEALRTSE